MTESSGRAIVTAFFFETTDYFWFVPASGIEPNELQIRKTELERTRLGFQKDRQTFKFFKSYTLQYNSKYISVPVKTVYVNTSPLIYKVLTYTLI